jgi:FAD/FMN-containing dehydrogenase
MRDDDPTPIGSRSMSYSVQIHAFREILDQTGVVDDPERIATYTTDQRQLFTGSTFAVLKPATTEQVVGIVKLAARLGFGIVPQGGNTSYCGGATPDASGRQIIVSLERMDRIREIDPLSMSASVDAGAILKNVQDAAAAAGLLLPLSLGAEGSCRIGGNIGTNAGGLSVVKYGMTRDLLLGIEAVLSDGTVVSDMRKLRKNNTGYDVKQFFVGSEGTLGIITGAVLRLAPLPARRATAWLMLTAGAPLAELLSLVRRQSADLLTTFEFMTARSIALATDAMSIGNVRGLGFMQAIELVTDPKTKTPDPDRAQRVIDNARARGLLVIKCGVHRNVIRFLAPLVVSGEDLDKALGIIDAALSAETVEAVA